MLIVIDLNGECETLVDGDNCDEIEAKRKDEERKNKERDEYYEWVKINEQVVPQVITVT